MWTAPASKTSPIPWKKIASWTPDATITAMCADADILFASTSDNRLLRSNRDSISESNGWVQIHHCDLSIGLAIIDMMLFVATSQNRLCRLDLCGLRQP
jgi:hypothetical protein